MLKRFTACLLAATVYALTVFGPALDMAHASQNSLSSPATGTVTGLQLTNNYNNALDSVNTCNSGASAPTNQLSGVPSAGNCWYNTSTGAVSWYDGADWLPVGNIDATNHVFTPMLGGGAINTSVASASTSNLCGASGAAPTQSYLTITGTTAITGFGSNCQLGELIVVKFSGVLTLTYNSGSMILPTAASITTAANDIAVAQYLGSGNWQVLIYQRATGAALSSAGLNIGASALANSALGALSVPTNLQLSTSVGSNNLTVAACTINSGSNTCNNASSANPILIPFRDATAANGDPVIISLQAALSFTVSSGNTMGCQSSIDCRLWLFAINEGGTVALCAYNALSGTNVIGLNEGVLYETGAGTGGGSSAQTLYCGTASTGTARAIRYLGYIEITETTAGTYASNSSIVQLMGPGIKKPGEIVQVVTAASASTASSTTTTKVQASPSAAIVPTSAADIIRVHAVAAGFLVPTGGNTCMAALSRSTSFTSLTTNAQASLNGPSTNTGSTAPLDGVDAPATTSSTTYVPFLWSTGSWNCNWNSTQGSATPTSFIELDEIMSALDGAANDNVNPGVFARAA